MHPISIKPPICSGLLMNFSDGDTVKTISEESMTYMAFASVDETDTTMNKTMPNNVKKLIYWLYLHCPVISLMLTLYSQKIFNLKVRINVWNISIIISKNVGAIMNHLSKIYIYGSSLGSCDSNEEFLAGTENVFKKCFKSNWITTSSQKRNVRPPK